MASRGRSASDWPAIVVVPDAVRPVTVTVICSVLGISPKSKVPPSGDAVAERLSVVSMSELILTTSFDTSASVNAVVSWPGVMSMAMGVSELEHAATAIRAEAPATAKVGRRTGGGCSEGAPPSSAIHALSPSISARCGLARGEPETQSIWRGGRDSNPRPPA